MSKRRNGVWATRGPGLALALAVAGAAALGACSSSSGEKVVEPQAVEAEPASGPDLKAAAQKAENENYPNLGDVPPRPPVTPPDQRIIIEEGLLADRANARYTDQTPRWATAAGGATAARGSTVDGAGTEVASAANPAMAAAGKIGTIAFADGSAALPAGRAAVLERVAAVYRASGGTLRVVGHTSARELDADPEKDKLAKFELSLARANAVAAALVDLGVPRERIVTAGRADTEPVAPPGGGPQAAENARADVFLEK
ncbi:MAG TPA: OmpA family protein [Alphaproteobacteria bacterium]